MLAGGRSRRFGADKTRLTVGGEGIVARAVRIFREAGFVRIWIIGGKDPGVPGAEHLPDRHPGVLGPSEGVATALDRVEEGCFAVAADMPALSVPLVKAVLEAWDGRSSAAAPRIDGRWEPLCALYARCALPVMEKAAREGTSLQKILTEFPAQEVELAEELRAGLLNVNTLEEWKRYQVESRK